MTMQNNQPNNDASPMNNPDLITRGKPETVANNAGLKQLTVTISGEVGAGKTTLAMMLANFLTDQGCQVSIQDDIGAKRRHIAERKRSGAYFHKLGQPVNIQVTPADLVIQAPLTKWSKPSFPVESISPPFLQVRSIQSVNELEPEMHLHCKTSRQGDGYVTGITAIIQEERTEVLITVRCANGCIDITMSWEKLQKLYDLTQVYSFVDTDKIHR